MGGITNDLLCKVLESIQGRLELRELAEGPQKPYVPSPSDQTP